MSLYDYFPNRSRDEWNERASWRREQTEYVKQWEHEKKEEVEDEGPYPPVTDS